MEEILKLKQGNTHEGWSRAIQDSAFNPIREMVLLETHAHHFLKVLEQGSVSTNGYLRRLHNFAVDMNWIPWPKYGFRDACKRWACVCGNSC